MMQLPEPPSLDASAGPALPPNLVPLRRSFLGGLALLGASGLLGAARAQGQVSRSADETAILTALARWRSLYSYGDRPFSFASFEDLYLNSDELLGYDNFSDDTRTTGWRAYCALWEPLINASFSGQRITKFNIDRVETSGDLGWSAIELWFTARRKGEPFNSSQYGTHVWRRDGSGRWRIIHEHMTGPI